MNIRDELAEKHGHRSTAAHATPEEDYGRSQQAGCVNHGRFERDWARSGAVPMGNLIRLWVNRPYSGLACSTWINTADPTKNSE